MANPAHAGRVAALLSSRANEYEEALKGIKEATPHEVVAVYDMDGDPERGRKYLTEIETKVKPDLIFAVGIWALQAVVSRPTSVPVVYAMVLNPPSIVGADAKNKELDDKSRQLGAASRHKSDFLANVSHELRTPMNAILGFNEMILDHVYGDVSEDLKRPLADIQQSGRHLLRLINDVLDLSKIEAGRMELAPGEYSVGDTVEAVRASLASLAAEKGLVFITRVPEDLPLAYGDSKRITQCLTNLAGNALKFTCEGQVAIAVERVADTLRFRVADTGIGIPRDRIERLLAEFQQADATIAREFGGTGLGLSIARKFVEMHGGRIWVESELGSAIEGTVAGDVFRFEQTSGAFRVRGDVTVSGEDVNGQMDVTGQAQPYPSGYRRPIWRQRVNASPRPAAQQP